MVKKWFIPKTLIKEDQNEKVRELTGNFSIVIIMKEYV